MYDFDYLTMIDGYIGKITSKVKDAEISKYIEECVDGRVFANIKNRYEEKNE